MPTLSHFLAIAQPLKPRVFAAVTALQAATQKPPLMNGFQKTYQPRDEEGETYPPEFQKVQHNAVDVLGAIAKTLGELFDVTAAVDWANCLARADVIVDGTVLLKDVPATYLLFLEKQLSFLHLFVTKVVELDPGSDWSLDLTTGLYKTDATLTQRTRKVQRPITLYEATKEHPAQTQLITEDVIAGSWVTTKYSGAMSAVRKQLILSRIVNLADAVKFARQTANGVLAEARVTGSRVFGYLFA